MKLQIGLHVKSTDSARIAWRTLKIPDSFKSGCFHFKVRRSIWDGLAGNKIHLCGYYFKKKRRRDEIELRMTHQTIILGGLSSATFLQTRDFIRRSKSNSFSLKHTPQDRKGKFTESRYDVIVRVA
ncbi:MAG: hypothetical protein PHU42_03555 [Patescibacteria group bacterium]|nr:hypothetical protein [Patescibacteria group bacterium]